MRPAPGPRAVFTFSTVSFTLPSNGPVRSFRSLIALGGGVHGVPQLQDRHGQHEHEHQEGARRDQACDLVRRSMSRVPPTGVRPSSAGQRADPTVRDHHARHDASVSASSRRIVGRRPGPASRRSATDRPAGSGLPRSSVIAFRTLMLTVEPTHVAGSGVARRRPARRGTSPGPARRPHRPRSAGWRTHRSSVNSSRFQQV